MARPLFALEKELRLQVLRLFEVGGKEYVEGSKNSAERVKDFIVLLHILRDHLSTMAVKSACSHNFLWLNLERESLYYNVVIDFNRKRIKPRKSG